MSSLYATPREVTDLSQCWFYHTADLPGFGQVKGQWDLRQRIDSYLGHVDFRGKRVLDVGAASGFLTFYMEERGADVVSYDLSDICSWDFVPFAGSDVGALQAGNRAHIRRLNNSYWLAHRARKSHAKLVHGTAYEIPEEIGPVQIAVFGSILLHLRDPFLALQRALQITTDTVIVAEVIPRRQFYHVLLGRWCKPAMTFLPRIDGHQHVGTWWSIPASAVQAYLAVLGFEETRVEYHKQMFEGASRLLYTVVGRRTRSPPRQPEG